MKFRLSQYARKISGFDIFGVPVQINFAGSQTYSTYLSSVCSIALYVFMIINLVNLATDYTGGKQEENTTFEYIDRFDSEPIYLSESGVDISIIGESFTVSPNLRRLAVYQKHQCDPGLDKCPEDEYMGIMGECSDERKEEIKNFALKAVSTSKAEEFEKTAVCLN